MKHLAVLTVLALVAPPAAIAAGDQDRSLDDLVSVLGAVLYPVQLMAYCQRNIVEEPAFLAAGRQWNERNWQLLADLEGRAGAAVLSDEARLVAEAAVFATIVSVVASQAERPAYCRVMAKVIDGGYYDIDRRADLAPALKRIFKTEQQTE